MTNFWKTIKKPITILAPMEEVTDYVFREIVSLTAKPDVLFTEFTSTDGLVSRGKEKVIRRFKYSENQHPIVAQIWGTDPVKFEESAKCVEELGFDGIDINMGCPDKGVMKKKSGAALINNQPLVEEIIKSVRKGAPNIPLSIKTRLDPDPQITKEWVDFLFKQDICALTIHGRTPKSNPKSPSNWEEIGKVVSERNKVNPNVILIGNGDVLSFKEILEKQKLYGVDGVMIGRGIFSNPWVFERQKEPQEHTQKEYFDLLVLHTKLFNETWGKTKNFGLMKKFFKIYIKGFNGADEIRQKLMRSNNYEDFCCNLSNTPL